MMNKKLPSIFKNTDHSIVNNNKKIFYSNFEDRGTGNRIINNNANNTKDIKDEYLFNRTVRINTRDGEVVAKIVSRVGDHILTSINKKILLSDIISISEN